MFTKYISKNIQQKLEAKKRALERKPKPQNDDDSRKGYLSFRDIATRTAFVRMCSNKVEPIFNKLIEGGLRDNNGDKRFGFDRLYSKEGQRKPTSGIKNIEVSYKGGFKAIRECVVTWVVPSLKELNELTPFFFTIGKTVVVDWGWVYSNQNYDEQLSDTFIQRVLKTDSALDQQQTNQQYMYEIQQDIFTNPQSKILAKDGDYDAIGGQISNFSYNLREDGGFDCTTKIISLGNSLFKRPLDMGANRAGLKISKNDDGKKTYRQLPPDSLINAIINLKQIVFTGEFTLSELGQTAGREGAIIPHSTMTSDKSGKPALFLSKLKKDNRGNAKNLEEAYRTSNVIAGGIDCTYKTGRLAKIDIGVQTRRGLSGVWVTWGWFEDQILSRYLSFDGGSKDGAGVKMTMRSLDVILGEDGKPISIDSETKEKFEESVEDITKQYQDGNRPDILKALARVKDIPKKKGVIDDVLRQSVQIRNPVGLIPINPIAFFIPGTDYTIAPFESTGLEQRQIDFMNQFARETNRLRRFAEKGSIHGSLRNIWINIKEIQKAFGISDPNSMDTTSSNVNPPGTVDVAVNNLLNALNANFHNVWNFELTVDVYNPTNIKVIDTSDSQIDEPQYTKFGTGGSKDTHIVNENGIYQFPSFKRGSFVKSQNLEFKIPDAQGLTALYGSNKTTSGTESNLINGQLEKFFQTLPAGSQYQHLRDRFLDDMSTANMTKVDKGRTIQTRVGSSNANPNSKLGVGEKFGVTINPKKSWWRRWLPDVGNPIAKSNKDKKDKEKETFEVVGSSNNLKIVYKVGDSTVDENVYWNHDENDGLVMDERVQYVLNSYLNANSPVAQFDMSNLIPAELGLEIDGTGGLVPFDLVHTDYIEEKYKSELINATGIEYLLDDDFADSQSTYSEETSEEEAEEERQRIFEQNKIGPLTFFQLFDATHKVDETGWKTELKGKMRLNRFPRGEVVSFIPTNSAEAGDETIEPKEFVEQPSQEEIESLIPGPIPDDLPSTDGTENTPGETLEGDPIVQNLIPIMEVNNAARPKPSDTAFSPDIDEETAALGTEPIPEDDYDDWKVPPVSSTIPKKEAKKKADNTPDVVPPDANPFPDINIDPNDAPPLDIGPILGPWRIKKLLRKGLEDSSNVNNDTDMIEYPADPEPETKPDKSAPVVEGSKIVPSDETKDEVIKTQQIISTTPFPELEEKESGIVTKPQKFSQDIGTEEAPTEPTLMEDPVQNQKEINKNITIRVRRKATLPPSLIESRETGKPKTTYRGTETQNNILYALREDWRPLYEVENTSPKRLSGYKFQLDGNGKRIPDSSSPEGFKVRKLVRKALLLPTRQKYWDVYIEAPNENGQTKVQYTSRDKFKTYPAIKPTGDLVRKQRSIYWYSNEFNPRYER